MGKALKLLQLQNEQLQNKISKVANLYEVAIAELRAYKAENGVKCTPDSCLLNDIKRSLEVIDHQEAVQRYKWMGLPLNFKLKENEIENLLYRSNPSLMLFYDETREVFCLLFFKKVGQERRETNQTKGKTKWRSRRKRIPSRDHR